MIKKTQRPLTAWEREVLQRLRDGETYREIAGDTFHAVSTVRGVAARAMKKLGAATVRQAVAMMDERR